MCISVCRSCTRTCMRACRQAGRQAYQVLDTLAEANQKSFLAGRRVQRHLCAPTHARVRGASAMHKSTHLHYRKVTVQVHAPPFSFSLRPLPHPHLLSRAHSPFSSVCPPSLCCASLPNEFLTAPGHGHATTLACAWAHGGRARPRKRHLPRPPGRSTAPRRGALPRPRASFEPDERTEA